MTDQRKRFADRYFETLNGAKSAIFAGYAEANARQQAYQLLQDPEVEEYLKKLREEEAEKNGVSRTRLLQEYKKIAFSDVRELYNVDGGLHNVKQIDDDTAGAISSIKSKELFDEDGNKIGDIIEVKTHDKIRALDAIGKHIGFFEKDNYQRNPDIQLPPSINIRVVKPENDGE